MTLKKRLAISNIFMILIPILILSITLSISFIIGIVYINNNKAILNTKGFYFEKDLLSKEINEELDGDKNFDKLSIIDPNNGRIIIYENNNIIYEYGNSFINDSKLSNSIDSKEIFIMSDERQLYRYEYNGYIVEIYSSVISFENNLKNLIFIIFVIILFIILISVVVSNYLLSNFFIKKITKPLDMLYDGTKRVALGDYNTHIEYNENDEFKVIIDEFNRMNNELNEAIKKIKKNDEDRKELILGITHDIRSPLTAIRGYTEGIIDGVCDTNEKRFKYLERIKDKCNDINNLVSKMITLTNEINENKLIDLKNIIEEFYNKYLDIYKNQGLNIEVNFKDDFSIFSNRDDLFRVLFNICDNSLKYKDSDVCNIKIDLYKEDNYYKLAFTDNGPGVNISNVNSIFDEFYRADKARTHPENGSGLGLAIVKKIILEAKGDIRAYNLDKGLRIECRWSIDNE